MALAPGAPFAVSFEEAGAASPVWVRVGGRNVVGAIAPYTPGSPYRLDAAAVQALPVRTPVCTEVARRARVTGAS